MKKIFKVIFFKTKDFFYFLKIMILSKEYSSLEECTLFCETANNKKFKYNSTLYSSENYQKKNFNNFLNSKNLDLITNPYNQLLIEFIGYFLLKYKFMPKIIDIGGGFGQNYFYLKKVFEYSFVYDVVETEALVKLSKINKLVHSNFYVNIAEASKNHYDLIYTSGTLQCIQNYKNVLSSIFETNINYIMMTRNNFGENNLVVAQYTDNGYLPVHQISFESLKNFISKSNYSITREINVPFSILEGNLGTGSFGKNLILKKIIK
jgi:putative methyltransferase (TIGR04325 family)